MYVNISNTLVDCSTLFENNYEIFVVHLMPLLFAAVQIIASIRGIAYESAYEGSSNKR